MGESTSPQGQTATLVARFDAARDGFLAAFAQAPDEALPYTPVGDEYALGVLPLHLEGPINRYLGVYDRMVAVDFGPVDLTVDPAYAAREAEQHRLCTVTKPTGAERAALLADLGAAHQQVIDRLGALDDAALTRKAPVIYSPGTNPYPTSAAEIFGWLIDHYEEHIAQTAQLIAQWQAEQAR